MADYDTVTELLIAQPLSKLVRLRRNVVDEINRLGVELRLLDNALAKKQSRTRDESTARRVTAATSGQTNGKSDGLPRADLLRYVREMGQAAVRPADVRDFLQTKGIVRRVEAIRNGLVRLVNDGELVRTEDGAFAVKNGDGAALEETPLAGNLLDSPGSQPGT